MPLRTTAGTAYDETGPVDAPTAVFLHGLGLDRHLWDGLTPHFADAYRVVRYDLTGHGDTPAPAGDLSLASFADQLLELLDHLGVGRAALVGFSLGGMINRRFALDYPDRTGPLVVLNSPHERDPEAQRLVEERATAVAGGGIGATIDSTLERWFTPGFRNQHPDTVARVRDTVLANDLDPYTRTRWVLAAGVPELVRPDPPITRPARRARLGQHPGHGPRHRRRDRRRLDRHRARPAAPGPARGSGSVHHPATDLPGRLPALRLAG